MQHVYPDDIDIILKDKKLLKEKLSIDDLGEIHTIFEKKYWDGSQEIDEKTRHICLHLGKLLGKISAVCEKREHKLSTDETILKEEVIPDLICYALMLAKLYDIDLQDAFFHRLEMNAKKITGFKEERKKVSK